MSSGYIYWDDEDDSNHNEVSGTVPSGVYGHNTRIYYCCMTNGQAADPITLPTYSPFYLFPFIAQCQEVQYMVVSMEYFTWDNEDYNNADKIAGTHPYHENIYFDYLRIYYCYYAPV